jgi:hypothetical protein
MQDTATVKPKEEFAADEGKQPDKENSLLVYLVGGQAFEEAAKGLSDLKRNGTVNQCYLSCRWRQPIQDMQH